MTFQEQLNYYIEKAGVSQKDLMNLKSLENDVLKLDKLLLPLQSSYTQSNGTGTG